MDLRLAEARGELLPHTAAGGALAARAHLALARALELEGDRVGARAHYRQAESGPDREVRRRAAQARDAPLPSALVEATRAVARARRALEGGERERAAALYRPALLAWPGSEEAAVRVAEDELLHGDARGARQALQRVDARDRQQLPWVKARALLVRAQLRDLEGRRQDAFALYRQVLSRPCGQTDLERRATEGLDRPFRHTGVQAEPGG